MRIAEENERRVVLRGRRQDGEVGESGLWLLWLVGVAFVLGGGFFAARLRVDGGGVPWMPLLLVLASVALLSFGVHRLARREELVLEREGRRLAYSVRTWPRAWRAELVASFDDVKGVRLRKRVEAPGGGRGSSTRAYAVWEARLLVRPRGVVELERAPDEEGVRRVARVVAGAVGTEVAD